MIGDVLVGIVLKFSGLNVGVAGMERLNLATKAANTTLGRQLGLINANTAAFDRHAIAMQRVAMRSREMRGALAGGLAIGGALAIGAAVNQAAKFQLAMTSVGNTLGTNPSQMRFLQQMALRTSGVTAQSATTIAQEMAMGASAGIGSFSRMKALFPLLARFADVQYFMAKARGQDLSPQDAVGTGAQFAHLFQAYSPAKMAPMLEWITKLQTVSPEPLSRALTQARYFIPLGNILGLKMGQEFELLASMAQTGFLRGRGGSSLGRTFLGAINAATLTGHAQGRQAAALRELGILSPGGKNNVLTAGGTLDWTKFTQILTNASQTMKPAQYASDLKAGFGIIATQFLSVFSSKGVQDQMKVINAQFGRLGTDPIGKFNALMNNFIPQFQRFVTNFVNLGINVFLPTLPLLTQAFKGMADALGRLGDFFGAHPKVAFGAAIASFGVVATAAAYAAQMFFNLGAALGVFRSPLALNALKMLPELFGGIGLRLIPVIGWIATAITVLVGIGALINNLPKLEVIMQNWWAQHAYTIGYSFAYGLGTLGRIMLQAVQALMGALRGSMTGLLGDTIRSFWDPTGALADAKRLFANAARGLDHGGHGSFGAGWATGLGAGFSGNRYGGYRVNITVHNPSFNFPAGTPQAHAKAFLNAISSPQQRTSGAFPSSPLMPFAASGVISH
jgi:hypothetical protein